MAESRRELLRQLHELELRAQTVRQRLSDDDPSSAANPLPLDPQSRSQVHELVIDHLSEAMLVVGLDGVILEASRPARWMFNLRRRNMGHVRLETIAGDLLDQLGPNWSEDLLAAGGLACSGRIDMGSARIEAEMLMVAVTELPRPVHCVLIRDVSAIRAAERENQELVKRLEEKHQELEAFTYRISHDLKSPLVTIAGFAKIIEEDFAALNIAVTETSSIRKDAETVMDDPNAPACPEGPSASALKILGLCSELQDHVQEIRKATQKARLLIDQLLDLARISSSTLELAPIDMRSLVEMSLKAHTPELRDARVKVVLGKHLGTAWGDFQHLSSVLDNLIANSIRFVRDLPEPLLTIKYRQTEEGPVWYVEDNGPGIAPENRERVFDAFVRMDRIHKGSGVGLAIVRRIVEMHGGRVWIEAGSEDRGTRVCFTLAGKP